MVAVGSLKKVWLQIPEDASEEEFTKTFKDYFGLDWKEILNANDMSFAYNSFNTAYFAVGDIVTVENITLDQIMGDNNLYQPPNIVVS